MDAEDLPLTKREQEFVAQSELFIAHVLRQLKLQRASSVPRIFDRPPVPLSPTVVEDPRRLSAGEIDEIVCRYNGEDGVAYFILANDDRGHGQHAILALADQLRDRLGLQYPMAHPMEAHPEAVRRFGNPDGTLKLYDLQKSPDEGYREQGETSELFAAHNDGLGYAGTVRTAIFCLDAPPQWGGYTYFANIVRLSMDLLNKDERAFRSLFLPDAVTAIRPRGKGAIKVTSPILFLNEDNEPSMFFRVASGEYAISFRRDVPALARAVQFLMDRTQPFGTGSTFAHFSAKGHGCIVRNQPVAHGRTEFRDSSTMRRVLARKWYMSGPAHIAYKHVPGMLVKQEFAALYPELFGEDVVSGEWNYDSGTGTNKRLR